MPDRQPLASLVESPGVRIRVLAGRVWVSEEGVVDEALLERGGDYVVIGKGRVIIEQEPIDRRGEITQIVVSLASELPEMWKLALRDGEKKQKPGA
jgi:hypothetical protein